MNRFRRSQAGEGQLGCIIGLIILIAAGFTAYKMIPVKVKAAEMRQEIVDEGKSAGLRNDKEIRANIMNKAQELGLPLDDKDLIIARTGNSSIRIEAKYIVPIEFPGYTYQWSFQHKTENPIF